MKAIEALHRLGGQAKADAFAKSVTDSYGVSVTIAPHINDDWPDDNWLNVLFETPEHLTDTDGFSMEKNLATSAVDGYLSRHGLCLRYECSGDGATGPIESYRVVEDK